MSESHDNPFVSGVRHYFTEDQISKMESVKVGIAGAGGLGSNCAQALVRSGFSRLKICDFDRVEASNLNRQYFFADQVGRYKVEALAENLRRINPDVRLELIKDRIVEDNVLDFFSDCQIVVEAFDGAVDKKMLIQKLYGIPKLLVAASGLAGWGDSDRVCIQQVAPSFFLVGDQQSEIGQDCPPCAPRVNIAAAKQADIVLDWVLSH